MSRKKDIEFLVPLFVALAGIQEAAAQNGLKFLSARKLRQYKKEYSQMFNDLELRLDKPIGSADTAIEQTRTNPAPKPYHFPPHPTVQ